MPAGFHAGVDVGFGNRLSGWAAVFAAVLWTATAFGQPAAHRHSFSGAEKWAKVFDDPARDTWQKPHEVIRMLALKPDAKVADIGSGTGYFSVRLAHFVPKGHVYGVDIEPDMVRYLGERAKGLKLGNVTAVKGEADGARLPEKVDLVLMVDTYHHIEEREKYFGRLRWFLNPGGRLAIIDFTEQSPMGPPRSTRIAPEQVKTELAAAGFKLTQEYDLLPYQYFLVFTAEPR